MKSALVSLLIGMGMLLTLYSYWEIYRTRSTFEVHFHDTYYVLSHGSLIVFVLLFLGTFFSMGGLVGTRFKSKLFGILTLISISVGAYYVVSFYKAYNGI